VSFSADWLALREPADRAARDETLLTRAAAAAGPEPVILDLGCGTGSTLRAMRGHLPEGTRWRLLDNDPDLLRRAAQSAGNATETAQADLADVAALPLDGVTLVTASALLDLVSEDWLAALAARLDVPLYAALSYDGEMRWTPADPRDAAITAAFNAHQGGDKGFGPALGPEAAARAAAILDAAGHDVHQAPSPWRLSPEDHALQAELTDGIADAAAETGTPGARYWAETRRRTAQHGSCVVGHQDILAIPRNTRSAGAHATG
jgi:SAM-dependent methyltransferase